MPPIVIPAEFGPGQPLSASQLNELQREILRRVLEHSHEGGDEGVPLGTDAVQDRAVTEPKLADGCIVARTIAAGAVLRAALADGAVDGDVLAAGAVGTDHIQDGAVTEPKLSPEVQLLLRRTGDSASSASQVIWRDPAIVWELDEDRPTIIDTWIDPGQVYWEPPVIGIDINDDPVQLNPRITEIDGVRVLDSFEVYDANNPLGGNNPMLEATLNEAIGIASYEIETSRGFEVTGGQVLATGGTGGVAIGDMSGVVLGNSGSGTLAMGGMSGGLGTGVLGAGAMGAGVTGAGVTGSGGTITGAELSGVTMRSGSLTGGAGAGMLPAGTMRGAMLRGAPAAAAPTAPAAAAPAAPTARSSAAPAAAAPAAATVASEPVTVQLTEGGAKAAARMTSVSYVDIDGKPTAAGAEGAFTVTSGFAGKASFFDDGDPVEYRNLGNQADRERAAQGVQATLYNLGIDSDFSAELGDRLTDAQAEALQLAWDGNIQFLDPGNTLWGGSSWLPDIMERPDLFGSGYAISGGRNIADVTRRSTAVRFTVMFGIEAQIGSEWVRVRFITPYKNSAYSVSVTPRMRDGYTMITAHIMAKTPAYCDIRFRGLTAGGAVEDVNKISFDLAVFGALEGST